MKALSAFFIFITLILLMATQPGAEKTTAYIASQGDGNVTRVFTGDETFDSIALADDPYGVAVTPDGKFLLVTRSGANEVTRIPTDNFTNASAQINTDVGNDPRGVAVEPEGEFAYVANFDSDTVSKFDISGTEVVETIDVGNGPLGIVATSDQTDGNPVVYVTNNLGNSMTIIDDEDKTTPLNDLCNGPAGVAVTPNREFLYVACTDDDTVKVVRTSDNTSIETISVGDAPWGVAVGGDGDHVFVTNSAADTVSVITTSDNKVSNTVEVGDQPMGVAAPRNGEFAYVVNQADDSVDKIDMSADSPTTTEILVNEIDSAVSLGAFIGGLPPSKPTDMTADLSESTEIDLTWEDNASDELGFKIERREDSEEAYAQIAKVDKDVTEFTDTGLAGGTTFHYRVRSFNEAADSDASGSADATTSDDEFSWCFIGTLDGR